MKDGFQGRVQIRLVRKKNFTKFFLKHTKNCSKYLSGRFGQIFFKFSKRSIHASIESIKKILKSCIEPSTNFGGKSWIEGISCRADPKFYLIKRKFISIKV